MSITFCVFVRFVFLFLTMFLIVHFIGDHLRVLRYVVIEQAQLQIHCLTVSMIF